MRRLRMLMLALAVAVVAGVSAWGQDEELLLLRLKFKPDQTMRYRLYAVADGVMGMNLPMPGAGMPSEMPMHMVMQGEAVAKVTGVDAAGGARLRVRADNLSVKMEMMGQKMEMSVKGGKYTFKQNGQQVEAGELPVMPGVTQIPLLQAPIEIKLSPRGETLDVVIPGLGDLAGMLPPSISMKDLMQDQILLPEDPLMVGQTWEDSRSYTLPGLNVPLTYANKMILESIENWSGGRRIANLRVESVTSGHDIDLSAAAALGGAPQGAPEMTGTMSIDQQLAGVMKFDVTRGMIIRFDFQGDQQTSMHSSFNIPEQGTQSMSMQMQFTIKGAVAKI